MNISTGGIISRTVAAAVTPEQATPARLIAAVGRPQLFGIYRRPSDIVPNALKEKIISVKAAGFTFNVKC